MKIDFTAIVVALGILFPLAIFGIWKLIEIIIWLFQHVKIWIN